ncbi:MAG: hypothetical protein RLY21_186 [Planctomycetota bacterium]|jgi:hypothetical protein
MRILLDESETTLAADTVGDALRQAAALAGERGRMIVEIEVDGIRWSEEDLSTPETAQRAAGELKLLTAHPAELLRETFEHSADAIAEVEEIQREAAKHFQGGRTKDGLNQLLEALALWGAVQTGLGRGLNLGVLSQQALQARGIDVDGPVQALETKLRELREAIMSQDFTTLSDCLMYEFPAVAQRVAALLRALAREADAVAASSKRLSH